MPGSIIHKPEADDDPLVGLYFDRSHSSTGTLTSLATSSARRLSQGLSLFASVRKAKAEEEEEEDHIFHSDSEEEKSGDILEARNGLSLQGPDALLAARWDHDLLDSSLVLTLVFRDGVQLWDCQRLATLRELAFVNSPEGADIACAQLLPSLTSNSSPRSSAWQHTPLLAYTCITYRKNTPITTLYIYSLQQHRTVKEISLKGHIVQLLANQHYILLSCTSPPSVHVLSAHTFIAHPISPITDLATHPQSGYPLVDLGASRMLAYASNTPLTHTTSSPTGVLPTDGWENPEQPIPNDPFAGPMARKVSQGAIGGMRALGDYGSAYWSSTRSPPSPPVASTKLSKSAPAGPFFGASDPSAQPHTGPCTVKVIDLHRRRDVAHFTPSVKGRSPATLLSFNPAGSLILVSTLHAHEFHIFQIRPPSPLQHATSVAPVWHRYRLARGITPAEARRADWAIDSRFVSVYTSHGTCHIFPIRPFGGQPSLLTHFQPHVVNAKTLVRPSVAARRSNLTRVDQEPPAASIPQSARLRSQRSAIPARLAASAVTTFDIDARNLESIQQEASSEVKGAHSIDRPMSKPILVFSPQEGALYLADLHLGRDSVTAVTSTAVSSLSSIIQRYGGSGQSVPLEGSHTLQVSRSLQWPLTGQRSAKTFNSSTEAPVEWSPLPIQAGEGQRWTALAEVRTFTFYRNILPRSPYLSHSLSFHIFAPNFDWAPAVLKPPSRRVAVRKEVEFSSSGSVPENHQDGIRLAMGDTLSLDARSASPGSPHYLSSAPISLNGVPGKSGMGQPWPIRALSPHLGAVQGGLKQIRSEWDRRQTKRAELAPSTEERSALSFEDDMSTFMLDGGGVPGSDVPSLGQTSGSCSTRDNSDDAWPQWEQGLSSPERPSPERSATGEGSDQPVEPFVLDEDFMTGLNEDAQPLIHLGVSPPEVSKTPLPPKLDARPPNRASRKSTGGKRGRR